MKIRRIALAAVGLTAAGVTTFAIAQSGRDMERRTTTQTAPDSMPLPDGWTQEDMMAYMEAGTPGEMHKHLAKAVGEWTCKTKMWMGPDSSPIESTGTNTVTSLMDGRYFQSEFKGEIPGMGPFTGLGVYGFDNVSETFQSTWIDNHSTGIMIGEGELASDKRTMTWNYTYNCPLREKPARMREIEKITGPNTRTLVMYGSDPKSGKEYKMMEMEMTRKTPERSVRGTR